MRYFTRAAFWLLICAVMMVYQVMAQGETCSAIIQEALIATDENCAGIGRNQVCYGNVQLDAQPQTGIVDFSFDQPGDVVNVGSVQTLTLTSRLEDNNQWGIALMQLQANLPNSLPGQNVTFLLFGDVEITNGVETNVESVTFDVTAQYALDVKRQPFADAETIGDLAEGETVTATGRDADSVWLLVTQADNDTGWVMAEGVTPDGDLAHLDIIDPEAINPMQAFSFQSTLQGTTCAEAPDSGLLVQTPEGVQAVSFTANEVDITLGSTAYLQAQPSGDMTISVVEGTGTVTAFDVTVNVPEGSQVRVPLDENGVAAGPPSQPEPYDESRLSLLPIRILPRQITIAAALTSDETPEPPSSGGGGIPAAGEYQWVNGAVTQEGCPAVDMMLSAFTATANFRLPGDAFDMQILLHAVRGADDPPAGSVFSSPQPDTYRLDFSGDTGDGYYETRVLDENTIEGELGYSFQGCTMMVPFTITRVGD